MWVSLKGEKGRVKKGEIRMKEGRILKKGEEKRRKVRVKEIGWVWGWGGRGAKKVTKGKKAG